MRNSLTLFLVCPFMLLIVELFNRLIVVLLTSGLRDARRGTHSAFIIHHSAFLADHNAVAEAEGIVDGLHLEACLFDQFGHIAAVVHLAVAVGQGGEI